MRISLGIYPTRGNRVSVTLTWVEGGMRILSSFVFVICFASSASAAAAQAPSPEMTAGVIGMTLAGGLLYLVKRRNRS
jgi:hypothetical protein